ncbi:MAG: TraR/DksA family transcriptional regulator [Nocardioides sp.]|uniref:TraR/DksA family transcriptional regulator n=1 Tax=Nocardioides sp. TaxID=35761 RepID=UPI0039E39958
MARPTIAGTVSSAARKLTGRVAAEPAKKEPPASPPPPATKAAAAKKAAPARKAPAKKAAATKAAPAKKAPATKAAPAKKAPATKAISATGHTSPVAKKAAVESAPEALVVKADEEAWTQAELAEIVAELTEQRDHSLALLEAQENELSGLMKDSGDGAGQDQADMGATSFERDQELSVVNSEKDKLAQIERALVRIEDGSYGVCESCGEPIGKMRLMAFPRATLCMPCKQREERR